MRPILIFRLLMLVVFSSMCFRGYALEDGIYVIKSKISDKPIEVADASLSEGANIQQWSDNNGSHQRWQISSVGEGIYSIVNANSGMAMEVYNFDTTDGANIVQWTYWAGETQHWYINDLGNGYSSIVNVYSDKSLDLYNFDTSDGANIAQWTHWGGDPQQWVLSPVVTPPDTLVIEENNAGFCRVDGSIDSNNMGFTGSGFANTDNQLGTGVEWAINVSTAGTYSFELRFANGSAAARPGALTVDGALVASVSFPTTGSWSSWAASETSTTWLSQGYHVVRLEATANAGLANIDSLSITGASLSAEVCDFGSTPTPTPPPEDIVFATPSLNSISVHDPSVIAAEGQFYIFGSHLSVARSADMQNWVRVADGVNAQNPIFNNVVNELQEALSWAETNTLWAPDVASVNGRYLMYYNACRGDSPLSALGIASASNVGGPYTNQGIILRSGMWGQPSADGTTYDANVHPNVVDPAVFFDQNGRLWMMYGSYSGGIFIMQLDPSTGFPYGGQGYGKHLLGGNHARIEGAYVIYSPETGFYYMFSSYGGLSADGGYNIRVSRSANPDGPYYDSNGTNMASVKGAAGTVFDDASIAPHGVKLMGNYVFSGSNDTLGYVSPGHNSAWRDPATGQYFLLFHTRFPGRGEQHAVRVHEFFFNENGWPVVSPLRYAKKVDVNNSNRSFEQLQAVYASEVPGSYQLINHGKDISAAIKQSTDIQLNSGGSISGGASGSWSYSQGERAISLVIDGTRYSGAVSRQWNQVRSRFEVTFSALSNDGTAVWGIRSN